MLCLETRAGGAGGVPAAAAAVAKEGASWARLTAGAWARRMRWCRTFALGLQPSGVGRNFHVGSDDEEDGDDERGRYALHSGCVNRLSWSGDGRVLASVSDDETVVLWSVHQGTQGPELHPRLQLATPHVKNVFGVRLMGRERLCTCAMDAFVVLYELGEGAGGSDGVHTSTFNCHRQSVQEVVLDPACERVFFSASADHTIRQFDSREPHVCAEAPDGCRNVLVNGTDVGTQSHCSGFTSVKVCENAPHLLAAAGSDVFVRVYDRRMLSLGARQVGVDEATRPLLRRAPAHLAAARRRRRPTFNSAYVTYVDFSPRDRTVLANYSCENLYRFDTTSPVPAATREEEEQQQTPTPAAALAWRARDAERFKERGNVEFQRSMFADSIATYGEALYEAEGARGVGGTGKRELAVLHGNRAAALLMRLGVADAEFAVQDCDAALRLSPAYSRVAVRRVRALYCSGRLGRARDAADRYAAAFPDVRDKLRTWTERIELKLNENGRDAASSSDDDDDDDDDDEELANEKETSGEEEEEERGSSAKRRRRTESGDVLERSTLQRYSGHINCDTNIKEAVFVGDEFVAAASDDGHVFMWELQSGRLKCMLDAGSDIVNCVQANPRFPLLATSGLESCVRLFSCEQRDTLGDKTQRQCREEKMRATAARNMQLLKRLPQTVPDALLMQFYTQLARHGVFVQRSS